MKTRIQYCDGIKETILHEDKDFRFLITTYNGSTEGKHVFFARVLSNPLASGWQFFDTEKEALNFGINHISKYLKEIE